MAVCRFLGAEFLPNFREYDFLMHWVEKPGSSIEAMNRITARASKELRAIPWRQELQFTYRTRRSRRPSGWPRLHRAEDQLLDPKR